MNLSLFKNVLYNWAGMLAAMVYAFFMIPFIIKNLGDTNYGLWNLIASVVSYVYLLDFGIQSAVNRYVAKYKATNDTDNVNAVYSNAIAVYSLIASGAVIAGMIVALHFDVIFNVPKESVSVVTYIAIIMVIYSAAELPLSVYGSILYAYQRFDIINIVSISALALQSALLLAFLKYDSNLEIFCYIIILVGATKYIVNFIISHRVSMSLKFRFDLISKETLGQMLKFSGVTFAAIIAGNIIFKTDNIIIGVFLDPKAITIYSIGFMLSDYAAQIIGKMCNTLMPKFSEHHAREETSELNSLMFTSARFSSLIGVPMGLAALAIGNDFLTLWLGPEYSEAYYIMAILMCARMCGFPTAPLYSMLYGIGKHHLILYTGVGEAALNLALSLALVQTIGIAGVAWGTFIPMLLGNIAFVILVCKSLDIKVTVFIRKALLQPIMFSGIFLISIIGMLRLFNAVEWSVLFAKIACIIVIYVLMFALIGLNREERRSLKNTFSVWLRKKQTL